MQPRRLDKRETELMSHPQQREFVESVRRSFPSCFQGRRVLEIGSLDVNGSVRQYFRKCDYTGLDVGEGPGVDVVCQGQKYDAPDGSFDVVISCEVMEHNPFWRETFENMIRLCSPGGLVVMTCASAGRPEHGTTRSNKAAAPLIEWEYYRNLVAHDFRVSVPMTERFSVAEFMENFESCDLYFAGFRAGAPSPPSARRVLADLKRFYWRANLRNWAGLKRRIIVAMMGDERYYAGPVGILDLIQAATRTRHAARRPVARRR